jgi:hypothetical protein
MIHVSLASCILSAKHDNPDEQIVFLRHKVHDNQVVHWRNYYFALLECQNELIYAILY